MTHDEATLTLSQHKRGGVALIARSVDDVLEALG